nr:translation initiation factor IF-2-like [Pan troglodytes]
MALLPGPGARAAPPRPGWGLRPLGNGEEGEEAERVGRKTAAPSGTEGLGGQTVALPAPPLRSTRSSEQRSLPLVEAQAQAPPHGEARPLAEPALSLRQPIVASPRADPVPAPTGAFRVAPPTAGVSSSHACAGRRGRLMKRRLSPDRIVTTMALCKKQPEKCG